MKNVPLNKPSWKHDLSHGGFCLSGFLGHHGLELLQNLTVPESTRRQSIDENLAGMKPMVMGSCSCLSTS